MLTDLHQTAAAQRGLVALVRQFDRDYTAAKRSRRVLDFGDLEHKTLDLLLGKSRSQPTAAAREIGRRYREIMVDEYQDSNGVQDAIFEALTREKQNCFMVGDVKQSIYQFRLADPGIFLEKYEKYVPAQQAEPGQGRKILLSHNFRSGAEVIDAVNDVFHTCMRPKVGGLTYDGMRNTLNVGGGTITGLADGGVYRGSSDAVTGNQLWQAYQRMDDLQESINIVGAHAAALSGLAPVPYNPYQPTTLSAAIGTYRDEYAVAVGVYHYVRDNVMFNLGASICSDGDLMGRAGISFAVGKKDKDKPALAKNMNDVQKQLMEVQYALQELKDENAALKKQLRKQ